MLGANGKVMQYPDGQHSTVNLNNVTVTNNTVLGYGLGCVHLMVGTVLRHNILTNVIVTNNKLGRLIFVERKLVGIY